MLFGTGTWLSKAQVVVVVVGLNEFEGGKWGLVAAFGRLFWWREGFLECWCRLKLKTGCAEWGTWNLS